MSLNPVRNNIRVIPRGDIRDRAEQRRLLGQDVDRNCWNIPRDLKNYKVPVTARLGDICPVEVVSVGPNVENETDLEPGDIVGLDPAQVLHEVDVHGTANWLVPARHALCKFTENRARPIAIGPNIMTLQDQAAQESVRSREKSLLILPNQEDGILSADGGSHMRVSFERVVSIGNAPVTFNGDDADSLQVAWLAMFGNAWPSALLGQLAAFAHTSSTTLRMFPERYRVTPWTKVHALYEP